MVRLLFLRGGVERAALLHKSKVFNSFGINCYYHPFKIPSEPELVSFGNNVIVATGVQFHTHDMSFMLFKNDNSLDGVYPYYTGEIIIGNNVMIGANCQILPNIRIGNNVIIGAGTVVTKDIADGKIVAGNPAREIGNYCEYAQKRCKK